MGQHRTRREKERAEIARLKNNDNPVPEAKSGLTYSYKATAPSLGGAADSLLKVDQKYIVKDLLKTLIISSILFFIVIGIYFYLRYN